MKRQKRLSERQGRETAGFDKNERYYNTHTNQSACNSTWKKKTGFQSGAQKGYSGISSHFVTSIICDAPILLQVEPESRFLWIILHAFFRRAKASEDRERRATGEGAEQILFFCNITKQFNSVTIIWTNFNLKY